MKNKRSLWVSLLSVVAIAVIALGAVLAAGWSPKLGLDLDGGLSVVYQTHTAVTPAQLDTVATILNDRVSAGGASGATVATQGKNQISVQIPGAKNTQEILAHLGNTAQLIPPALCYAPPFTVAKGKQASTGALPTCSSAPSYAANLQVTPDSSNVNGYTSNTNIQDDPAFAPYRSTPSLTDNKGDTVLLPEMRPTAPAATCWLRPR